MTLRDYTAVSGEQTIKTEVVVVGSGPGGAAISRVLAQAGKTVWILEEGPAQSNFRPNMAHTNRYHMQEGGAMVARGRKMMPIAAGRGVGGGSLVNSAICFRTPDHVLSGWTHVLGGDDRYRPQNLAPIFDDLEALLGVATTPESIAGENNKLIVRGVKAMGWPGGLVRRNTPSCVGCGICNYGCPSGGKASVDRNLIPMARKAGATIQADIKVDRIEVTNGRATGVSGEVRHPDTGEVVGRLNIEADLVVVSCGGIGTPRLLHHAGLASQLGPATGKGLHVHPGSAVLGRCDYPINMWKGATQGAWFEHPDMPGVLPHTMSVPPAALMMLVARAGLEAKASIKTLSGYSGCLVMVSDKGEGSVSATSDGQALIHYDLLPDDLQRIKEGMFVTAQVLLAGGAIELSAPVHGVGKHKTAESLAQALQPTTVTDFITYASHPMASCRMGVDPATSVIGPTGEAHGVKGLYLADSSIFPTSLGVNPQLTTMAMGTAIGRNLVG
ncbi:MAG: hypothetical protein GWP91_07425 [Rhodobacterales bacterium]|nr:hypothetical protein [Rhodobacterales bacterium]